MPTTRAESLREHPIGRLLLKFSIPSVVGMMVNALYNVVDRIYIGKLGHLQITGIGIAMPMMILLMGLGMLGGFGAGARVSIRLGQGRRDDAEHILGNAVSLLLALLLTASLLASIYIEPLLKLFGASADTLPFAKAYLSIILIGSTAQGLGFGLNAIVRAEGSPKISMYTMLLAAVTNIILDPIFIFVFKWGVRGAAIATVISQLIAAIWVVSHFILGRGTLRLRARYLKPDPGIMASILSIGISPFSMQVAGSIVVVLSNNALRRYGGDVAIGAMTVINACAVFSLMPIFGINQGAQPIIGFNYGAKAYARVKHTLLLAGAVATTLTLVAFGLTQFMTVPLIRLFNDDPQLIAVGAVGMRTFLFMLPVIGFQIVSANYFQAVGKAKKSMFLSLLRQVLVLIPMLLILPKFFGLTGVWMAGPISDFTASVVTAIFLIAELRHLNDAEHRLISENRAAI